MTEFSNVSVVKQANVYFDGKVNSRTVHFADGSIKTLGFMQPGAYTFNTSAPELMEILSGELDVQLPGAAVRSVAGGESFDVPGHSSFSVQVRIATDYCCSFLK